MRSLLRLLSPWLPIPAQTRYLIKAHPSRQWLVLKVTDDSTVSGSVASHAVVKASSHTLAHRSQTLKFRSRSTVILNRFEQLNRELTAKMAAQAEAAPTMAATTTGQEHAPQEIAKEAAAQTQVAAGGAGGAGVGGGGGGAGKKKKKGKGGKK